MFFHIFRFSEYSLWFVGSLKRLPLTMPRATRLGKTRQITRGIAKTKNKNKEISEIWKNSETRESLKVITIINDYKNGLTN